MEILKKLGFGEKQSTFAELSMSLSGVEIIERIVQKNGSESLEIEFQKLPHHSRRIQHWCMYQYWNTQLPDLLETFEMDRVFLFHGHSFSLGKEYIGTCFSRDERGDLLHLILHSPIVPKEMEGYESFMPFEYGLYLYQLSPFDIGKVQLLPK